MTMTYTIDPSGNDAMVKPILKWAGGKRWFASAHLNMIPDNMLTYYEPFLGSAAVFFALLPPTAVLSDLNEELIATYRAVRNDWRAVRKHLLEHKRKHSTDYYYKIRARNCKTASSAAARMIYLNRTCFNGIYRVNMHGEFNVPKGSRDAVIFDDDDFEGVAEALRSAELVVSDFAEMVGRAGNGDFVYVDPPYTVRHNNNGFLKYNEKVFHWDDQKRLALSLNEATERGVKVLISNANHSSIRELYGDSHWRCLTISRKSLLAASTEKRRKTSELVITNYTIKDQ